MAKTKQQKVEEVQKLVDPGVGVPHPEFSRSTEIDRGTIREKRFIQLLVHGEDEVHFASKGPLEAALFMGAHCVGGVAH